MITLAPPTSAVTGSAGGRLVAENLTIQSGAAKRAFAA